MTHKEEFIVDTSTMSQGKKEAIEIAESSREKEWRQPSFIKQLFLGEFNHQMVFPFPEQTQEDKYIGDQYLQKLTPYLKEHVDADTIDQTGEIPQNVIKDFFKLGVFAMKIPKEYGGLGLSQINYNRIMRLIASHCGSTAVLVSAHQSIGVPQPLKSFGTEAQKRKYFPRFRESAISAFALTEENVGSDPARISTEARLTEDGKYYLINGEKLWCTNGPIAELIVVMAKTRPKIIKGKEKTQISAFIVEADSPGIKVLHRCRFMGLSAIQNGVLKFTDVKVPVENLLGKEGRGLALALSTLNVGRLTLPATCAGIASQSLSIARQWAKKRVQWGQPIGYHQACASKIAYIASHTLAIEAITWITSKWADDEQCDIRIEAAMAKQFCTETTWKIVDETLQIRGGRGYEKATSLKARGQTPYPLERMLRDARINTIIEGTSEIMRLFLAREVLDTHLQILAPLIKKNKKSKTKGLFSIFKFYTQWYPRQWVNSSQWSSFRELGPFDETYSYIAKTAHKLARLLFHMMSKYQQELEKQQLILGHITDIGTELFAIAITCSYALSLKETKTFDDSSITLAKHFINLSKERIKQHFLFVKKGVSMTLSPCAHLILENKALWMENEIVNL